MAKMDTPMPLTDERDSLLLLPQERQACINIAKGNAPHCHRALALLALDQGVAQADAAELSGLTRGQVRYWRDKFNQQRLGIFPKDPQNAENGSRGPEEDEDEPRQQLSSDSQPTPASESSLKKKAGKKKRKAKKDKQGKAKRSRKNAKSEEAKSKKKDAKHKSKRGKKRKAKAKTKDKDKPKKKDQAL